MKLLKTFITRPVTVVMIVLLALAFGIVSATKMPVNLLPDMSIPMLGVSVVYPGAAAETVEEDVTAPLEAAVKTVPGVESLTTTSMDNVSTLIVEFPYGTDLDEKMTKIKEKLDKVVLPSDAQKPQLITVDFNASPVATLAMSRTDGDMQALVRDAETFKAQLEAVEGVGSVTVKGAPEYRINITPKRFDVMGSEVGFDSAVLLIVQALSQSALDIPLGTIMNDGQTVSIRNLSEAKSTEDIKKLPVKFEPAMWTPLLSSVPAGVPDSLVVSLVKSTTGIDLPVKEGKIDRTADIVTALSTVADIPDAAEAYDSKSYINGTAGISFEVGKIADSNSTSIVNAVKKLVKHSELSSEILLLNDQAAFIGDSIGNVLSSMLIGGALAIVIIFLFLRNVRSSLIVSVTMPLSVLAALIFLYLMGLSLNMVSLGGLAVGIGMLVDNSIVVIESISRRRDRGENAYLAALNGTKSVAGSIFASTLTTICVFFPIMFTGGLTHEIFTDLSLSVIFSLSLSFLVAISVIPCLYALFNGGRKHFLEGTALPAGDRSGGTKNGEESAASGKVTVTVTRTDPHAGEPAESAPEANAPAVRTDTAAAVGESASVSQATPPQTTAQATPQNSPQLTPRKTQAVFASEKPRKRSRASTWLNNSGSSGPVMTKIENGYAKFLPKVLGKKLVVILVALALFAGSIALVFTTGTEFLPSIDQGLIEVNVDFPSSTGLTDAERETTKLAAVISEEVAGIESLAVSVGKQGLLATSNSGYIRVQLKESNGTQKVVEQIRDLALGAGVSASVSEVDGVVAMITSGMSGLSVDIAGEDQEVLREISAKVREALKTETGFRESGDNMTESSVQYNLVIDKTACLERGIDYTLLVTTLRVGLSGVDAATLKTEGGKIGVSVSFKEGTVTSLDDLLDFKVNGSVRLGDVAATVQSTSPSVIHKENGKYILTVTAETYGIDTGTASRTFARVTKDVLKDYDGYTYNEAGVQSYLSDAFSGLVVALVISVFLLFAVMAAQFESAVKPLIVMASIPFSFTGGLLALVITRTTLNVVSFIGLIMLMGVIVNNAIVMLDKIAALIEEGMKPFDAVVEGAKSRLRPIFMTTLTTVLALFPLSLGLGSGGELMQPMGIVVIGGLLLGTLVTLVLIPAVYCAACRIKKPKPDSGSPKTA